MTALDDSVACFVYTCPNRVFMCRTARHRRYCTTEAIVTPLHNLVGCFTCGGLLLRSAGKVPLCHTRKLRGQVELQASKSDIELKYGFGFRRPGAAIDS